MDTTAIFACTTKEQIDACHERQGLVVARAVPKGGRVKLHYTNGQVLSVPETVWPFKPVVRFGFWWLQMLEGKM